MIEYFPINCLANKLTYIPSISNPSSGIFLILNSHSKMGDTSVLAV